MGYLFLLIHFIGLVLGLMGALGLLLEKAHCKDCAQYFKKIKSKDLFFKTIDDLGEYNDRVNAVNLSSDDFVNVLFDTSHSRSANGDLKCALILSQCPICKAESLERRSYSKSGKKWIELTHYKIKTALPSGVKIKDTF